MHTYMPHAYVHACAYVHNHIPWYRRARKGACGGDRRARQSSRSSSTHTAIRYHTHVCAHVCTCAYATPARTCTHAHMHATQVIKDVHSKQLEQSVRCTCTHAHMHATGHQGRSQQAARAEREMHMHTCTYACHRSSRTFTASSSSRV